MRQLITRCGPPARVNLCEEKFAHNPVTGTGSLSIPLPLGPGRAGFTAALALAYDSGEGNGPYGLGWSVGQPSISRRTDRGLPRYLEHEASDVLIPSGSEDLVPVVNADGTRFVELRDGIALASQPGRRSLLVTLVVTPPSAAETSPMVLSSVLDINALLGRISTQRNNNRDVNKRPLLSSQRRPHGSCTARFFRGALSCTLLASTSINIPSAIPSRTRRSADCSHKVSNLRRLIIDTLTSRRERAYRTPDQILVPPRF